MAANEGMHEAMAAGLADRPYDADWIVDLVDAHAEAEEAQAEAGHEVPGPSADHGSTGNR